MAKYSLHYEVAFLFLEHNIMGRLEYVFEDPQTVPFSKPQNTLGYLSHDEGVSSISLGEKLTINKLC